MASKSTSFYLSEDAIAKLDELAIAQRKTGADSNRSVVVETLIDAAYAQLKRIDPIRNAKGRIVGWGAYYGDHTVGEFDLLDKAGAVKALDAYVYEELSR